MNRHHLRDLLESAVTAISCVFAVPPRPDGRPYDPTRYPRTPIGAWRFLREQLLPTWLPLGHWLSEPATPQAVLRRAGQWRLVSWAAGVLLTLGVMTGGRLLPALAAGVLLLAIGERSECLGWISGFTYRTRTTAGGAR